MAGREYVDLIRPEPWIEDTYNLLLSSEDAQLSSEDYTMQYFCREVGMLF